MPNDKGCYNCSQRRIKCDRDKPRCSKCLRKGLQCPGYGVRYRFSAGIASRGKLIGRTLPLISDNKCYGQQSQELPPILFWPDGSTTEAPGHSLQSSTRLVSTRFSKPLDDDIASSSSNADFDLYRDGIHDLQETLSGNESFANIKSPCRIGRSLEIINARSRQMFAHFSEAIAPVMVVWDGKFNGYRDLVLPLACEDQLVRAAVSVVAMYHLGTHVPELRSQADVGYSAIISRLRGHAHDVSKKGTVFNLSVWATLIVLLTGETVSGDSNLPYLFKMLQYIAGESAKTSGDSAMKSFLNEQTRMMSLFAQPLLGETSGASALSVSPDNYFDFFSNAEMFYPTRKASINIYKSAIRQACNIYLARVLTAPAHETTTAALEDLRSLCVSLPPGDPGEHTLVWAYFIAAAESSTPIHRQFLYNASEMCFREQDSTTYPHSTGSTGSDLGMPIHPPPMDRNSPDCHAGIHNLVVEQKTLGMTRRRTLAGETLPLFFAFNNA